MAVMVKCVDCIFCIKMKSDVDDRKFFVCSSEYQRLFEMATPEKRDLSHSGALEKVIAVSLFKEMIAPNLSKTPYLTYAKIMFYLPWKKRL